MIDRRSKRVTPRVGSLADVRFALRDAARRQTPYSVVSALLSFTFVVTFIVDLWAGHSHIQRGHVTFWLLCFSGLVLVPLVFGRRYPRWAGLVVVGFIGAWSAYFMQLSVHGHAIINALLELPMTALYLGWFWRTVVARLMLLLNVVLMILALALRTTPPPDTFSILVALGYAILIAGFCLEAASTVRKRVERRALRDPLTDALNRLGLAEYGERLVDASLKRGTPLSVVAIDFDDFKAVNDEGGHAAGDAALVAVVQQWNGCLRAGELVARAGGDEFMLLLRSTPSQAEDRLRQMRESSEYAWSWGITRFRRGDTLDETMSRADAELYRAKGTPFEAGLDSAGEPEC